MNPVPLHPPALRRVALVLGVAVAAVLLAVLWLGRFGSGSSPHEPIDLDTLASYPPTVAGRPGLPSPGSSGAPASSVTLSGAGDIARCDGDGDEATASLLDGLPGWVFTSGDNAYPDGSPHDFGTCYEPTWGRHRERTFPALGNHEFQTRDATGYFGFFGERAGDPRAGWYATDLGTWRLIVLASGCEHVGGCGPESDQGRWLARELAAHPTACTIAIWHHPRYSTGDHGPNPQVTPFWQVLDAAGVELVVNGHDHSYERFAPLDAAGRPDPERGIRQFVVGTGGARLRGFPYEDPNSEVRDHSTYGVLRLDLHDGSYDWTFVPAIDGGFTDVGSATCH